eukprot:GGOE01012406.1.p1 GENE.GGOE01012406.1~~GGOE01012406.1.p1  ORF type:complete len:1001 (+),score=330.95 GGOE01012406.1:213-3005(+)
MAYVRNWRLEGQRIVFLPKLDHASTFVQMAQPQWSINIQVLQYFGQTNYWGTPSIFTDNRPANEGLLQSSITFAVANAYIPPSNKWYGYSVQAYHYERVAVITLADETQPYCAEVIGAVNQAVADSWRRWRNQLDFTVVLHRSSSDLQTFATAVEQMANAPDIVLYEQPPAGFQGGLRNRTQFLQFEQTDGNITRLTVNYTVVSNRSQFAALQVKGIILKSLPSAYKTATYYADQTYLQGLASAALAYNPTLGTSSTAMPVTRLSGATTNACMAGECPMGDLFTDAYVWRFDTDIGISTSGGLRGPGWAAGPIKVSDIWAAMPFANNPCTATVLGVTLFDIFNRSTALATFTADIVGTSDRLLQVSGARLTYNAALSPITGRLIAIDVWDKTTQQYLPLERLKLYTIATDSYFCGSFDSFPTYVSARYTGEVKAKLGDGTLQDLMGMYLQANSPITPTTPTRRSLGSRMVTSDSVTAMPWKQTLETCPVDTMWTASIGTCMPCPDGLYQPAVGQTSCITKPVVVPLPSSSILVPVVAGCVGGGGALILVLLFACRKRDVRDIANAPKKGRVTLLFTDIQDSTRLWGAAPESMARSLDDHHGLIRDCIRKHKGYEVKTVGDSFMIAVGTPEAGVAIAMDIQLALQHQQFPSSIEEIYAGNEEDVDDNPDNLAPLHPTWNGLRVRIGIHTGEPDCILDTVTKGYDYYGPAVNVAARVESAARGGQVLVSESVFESMVFDPQKVDVHRIGPTPLKGVAQPVVLYQVLPQSLVERSNTFGSRKISIVAHGADIADGVGSDTGTTATATGRSATDLILQHPLVRQGAMTVEQVEVAMQDISQALLAVFRLVPKKTADGMVGALAKAWRTNAEKTREDTMQMIALRAMPSIPRYRAQTVGERQNTLAFSDPGGPLLSPGGVLHVESLHPHIPLQEV